MFISGFFWKRRKADKHWPYQGCPKITGQNEMAILNLLSQVFKQVKWVRLYVKLQAVRLQPVKQAVHLGCPSLRTGIVIQHIVKEPFSSHLFSSRHDHKPVFPLWTLRTIGLWADLGVFLNSTHTNEKNPFSLLFNIFTFCHDSNDPSSQIFLEIEWPMLI